MKNKLTTVLLFLVAGVMMLSVAIAQGSAPGMGKKEAEETLKKEWPSQFGPINYQSFNDSPVTGLYEVVTNGNIVYYQPPKTFVFGEIVRDGISLTGEKRNALAADNLKKLDLTRAVKIGSGKKTVIEFTDPDCPYCRKATEFISSKRELSEGITKYIFFMPLPFHKEASNKAKYIICSKDRTKAYEDMYAGRLDGKEITLPANCDEKAWQGTLFDIDQPEGRALMASLGIKGFPHFFIDGKAVSGADTNQLEKLIGNK